MNYLSIKAKKIMFIMIIFLVVWGIFWLIINKLAGDYLYAENIVFFFILGGSFADLFIINIFNGKLAMLFNNQKFTVSYISGWLQGFMLLALMLILYATNAFAIIFGFLNSYFYQFFLGFFYFGLADYIIPFKKWVALSENKIILGSLKPFQSAQLNLLKILDLEFYPMQK